MAAVRFRFLVLLVCSCVGNGGAEILREFKISENLKPGTRIGFISESQPPPYLIVPIPGSNVDSDLQIEESGEIRTRIVLDRETRDTYTLVAIPTNGENIRVVIHVQDDNDNSPSFPQKLMEIEFAENTPRDVKRTLLPARDKDLDIFNTQRYVIASGNVNNAFRLSSHRERDGVLYLDLQVNGFLDRETVASYTLVIEAFDGGVPPLKGSLVVKIKIKDVNDNSPVFNQSKYFATLNENSTIGTRVLQVFATDTDEGENGRITYAIKSRVTDKHIFNITKAGIVVLNRRLDFETKELHELIIVAKDNGVQPLETTVFASVRVLNIKDNSLTLDLIFLTEDGLARISEKSAPGEFVARVSVLDREKNELTTATAAIDLELSGGDGKFKIDKQNGVYYVVTTGELDRESVPVYNLTISVHSNGLSSSHSFRLQISDWNDNPPVFDYPRPGSEVISVFESSPPGTSVVQVHAVDKDIGANAVLSYRLLNYGDWFRMDEESGLITTLSYVDCEIDSLPILRVLAVDHGTPSLSTTMDLPIHIHNVNNNAPLYEFSFYNVSVPEDLGLGSCILNVTATDPDCGINSIVNYTIGQTDDFIPFKVDSETGRICTTRALDYEQKSVYEIQVFATDRGGLKSTTIVKIHIQNLNDNPPTFNYNSYNISIKDGHLPSTPILVISAVDKDGDRIEYSADSDLIRIDPKGQVFLTRPIHTNQRITVSAWDGKWTAKQSAEIFVNVIRGNEIGFKEGRYRFSVEENKPIGTIVGQVGLANGRGSGSNSGERPSYSISAGQTTTTAAAFTIDANGVIKTTSVLDHERQEGLILLNVQATTGPGIFSHSQVEVKILDVNDCHPKFHSPLLTIWVPENAAVNSTVYAVYATDDDEGRNGQVNYRIHDPTQMFKIDPRGGQITLNKKLDYESAKKYTVIVQADDEGQPKLSSNMTVIIQVQDTNDNPPQFDPNSNFVIEIKESTEPNTEIAKIQASDADTGNNAKISYKLSNFLTHFAINPTTGALTTKSPLDRETQANFELNVTVWDHGSPSLSSSKIFSVRLQDENDNAPVFTRPTYTFELEENNRIGARIGSVLAMDPDEGQNGQVQYSILQQPSIWQIGEENGLLTTTASLDREKQDVYEFQVTAMDNGHPHRQSETIVRVIVRDVNDNPPSPQPEENLIEIKEELPSGTEVTRIVATDPDEGENGRIMFFSDDSEHWEDFTLDSTSGILKTATILNHERKSTYTLSVRIRDNGKPQLETIHEYRVEVLDLNDNRPSHSRKKFSFEAAENTRIGQVIGDIGTDPSAKYVIMTENGNSFGISRNGSIFTTARLNSQKHQIHTLQIKSISPERTENFISVDIGIKIIPSRPAFKEDLINVTVEENIPIGTEILNLTADSNSPIYYSIAQQVPELFKINKLTGVISSEYDVDYELTPHCVIVVVASVGELNASVTVFVHILDLNDNSPIIVSDSNVTIYSANLNTVIHTVIARDLDSEEAGRLVYGMTHDHDLFSINQQSGEIKVLRPVDFGYYQLNVTVSDGGEKPNVVWQVINMYLKDTGVRAPRFLDKYNANVMENSLIGKEVLAISAVDFGNSTLTYLLPEGQSDGKFKITSSGSVYVNSLLDRETKSVYNLKVFATNHIQSTSTAITIKIKDINDNVANFHDSCHDLSVPENQLLGIIHTFKATDSDAGRNAEVTFGINSDLFSVDMYSGKLSSLPLDREKQSVHNVIVTAQDRGLPIQRSVCNFSIHVEDENDSSPEFTQGAYSASLYENTPIGTRVLQVKALDADIGINALVTYSITNETNSHFVIDNQTGVITTAGPLDREKIHLYTFEVVATDGGLYDSRFTKASVSILLKDVNDNRPIVKNPIQVQIPVMTKQGHMIVQMDATDKDEGRNSDITYSLESNEFFRISPTGQILAAKTLSSIGLHQIIVTMKDRGSPALTSKALVEIQAGDVLYSNKLKFQETFYKANILEGTRPGTDVLKVTALRNDGKRQRMLYSIISGNEDNKFEITQSTGQIRVKAPLDREDSDEYSLVVIVKTDSQSPPLTSHVVVNITLTDENDNAPIFYQQSYFASIWEGNHKGTFVTQVKASDADSGANSNLIYHIVDGNSDNAFVIEPPFSGIVKTNIVLDREIQDKYKIVIIAMDEGTPQMTGTTTLAINVIDINDTPPTFPPSSLISLAENSTVGSIVTTISANDVDANPNLVYEIVENWNGSLVIGKYSGVVYLAKEIDYETEKFISVKIQVSDSVHTATTLLNMQILDSNDISPMFEEIVYEVDVEDTIKPGYQITKVTANDKDTGLNGKVTYSLENPISRTIPHNITIDENGVIRANGSLTSNAEVTIIATDSGEPRLSSKASLLIRVHATESKVVQFQLDSYSVELTGAEKPGTSILQLHVNHPSGSTAATKNLFNFEILDGNVNKCFSINRANGRIYKARSLVQKSMNLKIGVSCALIKCTAMTNVIIKERNTSLELSQSTYEISVSESKAIGSKLLQIRASNGMTGSANFELISGNDQGIFNLSSSGALTLARKLDYESATAHHCIVRANSRDTDNWAIAKIHIQVLNENDYAPKFPWAYSEFVAENEIIGTPVFTAKAIDLDSGVYGQLNYSLQDSGDFTIDPQSGVVKTRRIFDFESKSRYYFKVTATDAGGKSADTNVVVEIESRDEFPPEFKTQYKFIVPSNAGEGYMIGQVEAEDKDGGIDGRVIYQIQNSSYFRVNRTTGQLSLKKIVKSELNGTKLVVVANSGLLKSKSARTKVEIGIGSPFAELATSESVFNWLIVIIVTLLIIFICLTTFVVLHVRGRKQSPKAVESYNTNTLEYISTIEQPHYEDEYDCGGGGGEVPRRANSTGSELSNQTSSGRGSADDNMEDEEIAMINNHLEAQGQDEGAKNAQEYFARLGIVPKVMDGAGGHGHGHSEGDGIGGGWTEDNVDAVDISNLIYSQIEELNPDVIYQPSMNGSISSIIQSEENPTYNWDYLLDWGPQYQPLAQVFAEIAEMKDGGGSRVQSSDISRMSDISRNSEDKHSGISNGSRMTRNIYPIIPRSPISHDNFCGPMRPSFSPALSPLANRSPSISPLVGLGPSINSFYENDRSGLT